ncbi:zinc ribbon domain-containing protein [Devosia pacifica]|uniref:zinc ribbon domain-containing protein n=1 Tax=Devosia pacifica TaxID=1335967 RepID=UPI0016778A7D|nr:zinc ribbon domain-containing protein [Devosia pacifica]
MDEAIYGAVQAKLKRNNPLNTAPRIASADHLLTGIAVCSCCGGALTITTGKSGKYKYYSCRTHLSRGKSKCPRPTRIPAGELDRVVTEALIEKVVKAEHLASLLGALAERRTAANVEITNDILKLEQRASEERRALDNIFDLVEKGIASADDPDFARRFEAIKSRKSVADEAVKRARASITAPVAITPEMVVRFSEIMRAGLTSGSKKFRRAYVSALIDRVTMAGDKVVIRGRASSALELAAANCNFEEEEEEVPRRIQEWRAGEDETGNGYVIAGAI